MLNKIKTFLHTEDIGFSCYFQCILFFSIADF
jgi:hypothetical protein